MVSEHQLDLDGLHFLEFIHSLLLLPSQCYQFSCGHLSCGPLAGSGPTFSPMLIYPSNPPHMQSNFLLLTYVLFQLVIQVLVQIVKTGILLESIPFFDLHPHSGDSLNTVLVTVKFSSFDLHSLQRFLRSPCEDSVVLDFSGNTIKTVVLSMFFFGRWFQFCLWQSIVMFKVLAISLF